VVDSGTSPVFELAHPARLRMNARRSGTNFIVMNPPFGAGPTTRQRLADVFSKFLSP
jgi:hypothetical protein